MSDEQDIVADPRPMLHIVYEAGTQSVQIANKNIGNLDFALGMLEMAKVAMSFQRNMIVANQLDAQQMEARKAQAIAASLRNGGPIR